MVNIAAKKKKVENLDTALFRYGLLMELMDNTPDVIYFKDRQGHLILVNRAYAKGLGTDPDKALGKTDYDIFPKERADLMAKDDEYVMSKGKSIIDKIERATRVDGIDNYVSTTKIPRFDEKGNCIGLVGITRDITHRKQIERLREEKNKIKKQLAVIEELSKLKSDFLSIVSHELRTPITVIKDSLDLILSETKGAVCDDYKKLIQRSFNNTERLKRIIEELLDISRIEKGKLKLRYSLVNLNELVKNLIDSYEWFARQRNINLTCVLPKEEVNIFIDTEKVNQIITNLVDNAMKFTDQGGKIELEVVVFEDKVRVGIFDSGVGIAREDQDRIFDKFVQIPSAAGVKNKGLGLGLSIVKQLVEKHNGEIWVESKPGTGSRFYFTLSRFYSAGMLEKDIRERINSFLSKGVPLYLINMLIVHYHELKEILGIDKEELAKTLNEVVDMIIADFLEAKKSKQEVTTTGFRRGECNVVFPNAEEKEANRLFELLKRGLNRHFQDRRIENIFVNMAVLDFSYESEEEIHGNKAVLHVKKLHIGAEKRHFKRIERKMEIEIASPEEKTGAAYTVDISEGGMCFITNKRLRTDSILLVKLNFPDYHKVLSLAGRVAWLKQIKESRMGISLYKIGMEFTKLDREDKLIIHRFIEENSKPR